jgi:undecaprenyl phosphate N,N'-diacetylbacillosamine 1-phosphate transferase
MYKQTFKRLIDFCFALIAIFGLSPIIILIFLLLFFANRGSGVFFVQERPGKNITIFKIIKFKTMNNERDSNGNLLPEVERLTKIGSFIRNLSLDEIPQLINVLKGDMSLIGPRPLMPQYLPLYSKKQSQRHEVRPGITGWAQVNGRNSISWKQKFEYDVWYVGHLTFWLDVRIVLLTIKKVLIKDGIYKGEGIDTMEAFNGVN